MPGTVATPSGASHLAICGQVCHRAVTEPHEHGDVMMSTTSTAAPTVDMTTVFFSTPDLAQWWVWLVHSAPGLASAIGAVRWSRGGLSVEQAEEAIWRAERAAYGPGWVHFAARPPSVSGLQSMAMGAAYSLRIRVASILATFLGTASEDGTRTIGKLLHAAAHASGCWSIDEVEKRLGTTLARAYASAGCVPLWTAVRLIEAESGHWELQDGNPQLLAESEPHEFILNCLEGHHHEDDFWWHYARLLFPEAFC
jgi:hypothetical protein